MTLQEAISEGLAVTGVGLTIVFSVLLILMVVLMVMKKIFYKEPAQKIETKIVEAAPAPAPVKTTNDEELIAVLTAAIAASLNTSTYNLKIKSFRRIGSSSPLWNKAGVTESISGRF